MIVIYFLLILSNYSEQDFINEILNTNNPKKIENLYKESQKKFPESYQITLNTAYKFLLMKKYKKSYILYKKSYEIYPSSESILGLTLTQTKLKKFKELLKTTSNYKYKGNESEKWIYLRRSYAYINLKKYQKALSEINKALKKYPDFNLLKKNKNYIENLQKPHFGIIPISGFLKYDKGEKDSYTFFGTLLYLNYKNFSFDFSYTRGTVKSYDISGTENDLSLGAGYNNKINFYLHFEKIKLSNEDALNAYFQVGYDFNKIAFQTYFTATNYQYLQNPVYQYGVFTYLKTLNNKFIPFAGINYKYLKDDEKVTDFFYDTGFIIHFSQYISFKTMLEYNPKYYTVSLGGIVDNSVDNVSIKLKTSIKINIKNFILTPEFTYYSLDYEQEKIKKYMFNILTGYKF